MRTATRPDIDCRIENDEARWRFTKQRLGAHTRSMNDGGPARCAEPTSAGRGSFGRSDWKLSAGIVADIFGIPGVSEVVVHHYFLLPSLVGELCKVVTGRELAVFAK